MKNSAFHVRTKHIDRRYYFIKSLLEEQILKLEKIHTNKNTTNILTKVVMVQKLELCKGLIDLHE